MTYITTLRLVGVLEPHLIRQLAVPALATATIFVCIVLFTLLTIRLNYQEVNFAVSFYRIFKAEFSANKDSDSCDPEQQK